VEFFYQFLEKKKKIEKVTPHFDTLFIKTLQTFIYKHKPSSPLKLQMALAQLCKNTLAYLCKHPNIAIAKGRNRSMGC
jgi:hypothetical protein